MSHPNLSASYLGLSLKSPIVVGSCPLTLIPEKVREMSIAGAGAVVLPSLFEEQIVHLRNQRGERVSDRESQVEWLSYEQIEDKYNGGPEAYLESISHHKKFSDLPVIASLNGCTGGHWLGFAVDLQRAGADAIELMLEPEITEPSVSGDRIERELLSCVTYLCDQISIPVSVKLSPYHTNLANLAWRLAEAGASGMVGFAHATSWEVSAERIVVRATKDGVVSTIALAATTKITRGKKTLAVADLKVGDRVVVNIGAGKAPLSAKAIQVGDAPTTR